MARYFNERKDIENHILMSKWTNQPTTVTINSSTNRNANALSRGTYYVIANTACYFLQGTNTVNATTSDHYLPAGERIILDVVESSDQYVAVIRSAADGKLFIHAP